MLQVPAAGPDKAAKELTGFVMKNSWNCQNALAMLNKALIKTNSVTGSFPTQTADCSQ